MEVFGMVILQDFLDFYTKKILGLELDEAPKWQLEETPLVMGQVTFITNINQEEEV
jgi:hypothetical protein